MADQNPPKPEVPNETTYRWHKIVGLTLAKLHTPVAVITRRQDDAFTIFYTHVTDENPFKTGDRIALGGSFTDWVIKNDSVLHVKDASQDDKWKYHRLIDTGLVYYLGYPLHWPDGEIFGTIAVYDHKANDQADKHQDLLAEFCHEIEQDLLILIQQQALRAEIENRRLAENRLSNLTPKEFHALWHAAQSVLANRKFEVSARIIFDEACNMTGAVSGYVALLTDDGKENDVLFLDSGGLSCAVDPSLPMPIRGLRAEAYKSGKAVYDNDFMNTDWVKFMPEGHVVLKNVLFAPLNIKDKTVGIIGLANKNGDFTDFDASVAEAFGEIAAIALSNSRTLDQLDENNRKLESFNETQVDREYRIIEVKQEVNELCRELGREPIYKDIAKHAQ
ncbi:MAG: GAF domain-containing protein [Candidatus Thiodiazotropha sp.]